MNNAWKIALSSALLAAVLAGCGANSGGGNTGAETAAETSSANGQGAEGTGDPQRMERGTFGKVKSVDGQTVTVYTSSFTGRGQGGEPPQSGYASAAPSDAPQGDEAGAAPSDAPQGGGPGGPGGMNMDDMFTDETVTLTVTGETSIVKRTFENNEMKETEISLSDLKADDIITYTLVEGSEDQVATISVGMGGFGGRGGGMGGQAADEGQTEEPGDTETE